ncbi:MAG TPA: response regulator transcription factor [Candidatus Aquabacterium excrementipullorum]|nr:response regulator transcription factor [Candidatus Aquabacterium excrementipullorum]
MSAPRLLLIDDHALFRTGLRLVLDNGLGPAEFFEASSLEEAMAGDTPAPHVVLLDIQLKGLNGLEGMALVQRRWPAVPVLMLSSDTSPATVRSAMERGAAAFASKADGADHILGVLRQLLRGEAPSAPALPKDATARADELRLTARQCEVLDLVCQGLSNKLIARRLNLSENTVRGYVQTLLVALNVASRSQAAFEARRRGLIA